MFSMTEEKKKMDLPTPRRRWVRGRGDESRLRRVSLDPVVQSRQELPRATPQASHSMPASPPRDVPALPQSHQLYSEDLEVLATLSLVYRELQDEHSRPSTTGPVTANERLIALRSLLNEGDWDWRGQRQIKLLEIMREFERKYNFSTSKYNDHYRGRPNTPSKKK